MTWKNLLLHRPPVKRGDPKKLIAFTFDDGPSQYTGALLDGLRDRGAAATFFMTGENGTGGVCGIKNGHEALLARMWEEGHQLANHTYRHADFRSLTEEQIAAEVSGVEDLIFEAAGGVFRCFVRTPGGFVNDAVLRSVNAPIIRWSPGPFDWKYRDTGYVYDELLSCARHGAIILLHDLYETTVEAALRAIDALKEQGFAFVTAAELMRRTGIHMINGAVYYKGKDKRFPHPAYEAPAASVSEVSRGGSFQVSCSQPNGLPLRCTTDGSFPRLSDHLYTGPVSVEPGTVFTAIGVDEWGTRTPPVLVRV